MRKAVFMAMVAFSTFLAIGGCDSGPRLEGKNERAFTRSLEDLSEELSEEEFSELTDALDLFLRLPNDFVKEKGAKNQRDFTIRMVSGLTVPQAKRKVGEVLVEFADSRADKMLSDYIENASRIDDERAKVAVELLLRNMNSFAEYRAKKEYAELIASQGKLVTVDNAKRIDDRRLSFDVTNRGNTPVAYISVEFFVTARHRTEPFANADCELYIEGGLNPGETKNLTCRWHVLSYVFHDALRREGAYLGVRLVKWEDFYGTRYTPTPEKVTFGTIWIAERLKKAGLITEEDFALLNDEVKAK